MSATLGKDKLPPGMDGPRPDVDTFAGVLRTTSWTPSTETVNRDVKAVINARCFGLKLKQARCNEESDACPHEVTMRGKLPRGDVNAVLA